MRVKELKLFGAFFKNGINYMLDKVLGNFNNVGQLWTLVFQTADRKGYCRVELGNCDEVLRV